MKRSTVRKGSPTKRKARLKGADKARRKVEVNKALRRQGRSTTRRARKLRSERRAAAA